MTFASVILKFDLAPVQFSHELRQHRQLYSLFETTNPYSTQVHGGNIDVDSLASTLNSKLTSFTQEKGEIKPFAKYLKIYARDYCFLLFFVQNIAVTILCITK